ncbi:hypothetical protein HanLR1_Chr07g0242991 [Helianthus annuus]|nr:hypothetical protein HanLR1_Chr07g0242991 [Helianthus annuus]
MNKNVVVIKGTNDMNKITLVDLISLIKSYDLDDKQREINHPSSYNIAAVGGSNSAFVSQDNGPLFRCTSNQPAPPAYPLSSASTSSYTSTCQKISEYNCADQLQVSNSKHAYMTQIWDNPPTSTKVTLYLCSQACIENVASYRSPKLNFNQTTRGH